MKEEIEKRRAEAAEKKKQKEDESVKISFTVSPKGSSKVRFKSCSRGSTAQQRTTSFHHHLKLKMTIHQNDKITYVFSSSRRSCI